MEARRAVEEANYERLIQKANQERQLAHPLQK
jgi:hypothetical protein